MSDENKDDDDDNKPSALEKLGVTTAVGVAAEVAGFYAGIPGLSAGTTAVVLGMYEIRRQWVGDFFARLVHKLGGEDKLVTAVENSPERQQLLWNATQAVITTPFEAKRRYLADVAAHALTGDKKAIDTASLIVAALSELESMHIEALTRISAAYDDDRANPTTSDKKFQSVLRAEPAPVLAALVRTGVVLVGSQEMRPGLHSIPRAETFSITGVNDFGRDLLADLESVELD